MKPSLIVGRTYARRWGVIAGRDELQGTIWVLRAPTFRLAAPTLVQLGEKTSARIRFLR